MRYPVLLFDFDHTLFDSARSEEQALETLLGSRGVAAPHAHLDTYRTINQRLWGEAERGLLSPAELSVRRFVELGEALGHRWDADAMSGDYLAHLGAHGELYPGTAEVLHALGSRHRLALVTNAISIVNRTRLERSGVGGLFEAVVISTEIGATKPDERFFDVTFDRLGGPRREEVLIVGDSLSSDIAGGARYGIDTCWYNPGRRAHPGVGARPTHTIASLRELERLV